jgi:putative copper export protein
VGTGVFSAWLHLGTVPALWTTGYGRTLLLKLGVASLVFGTGAYNWLRVKPALEREEAAGPLRRSATIELTVALVVLAVTAVLVATPLPSPSRRPVAAGDSSGCGGAPM